MLNQFGQHIEVGDWVGWVSKTGSHTDRKVGRVVSFGERKIGWNDRIEATVVVHWLFDGTYGHIAKAVDSVGKGVGITRLLKLDPAGFSEG